MIRATALLLLVQAASYHQASVPSDANLVLTTAAGSLDGIVGLDYDLVDPMFKDITFMKESLVELMPYLEEAERPVIKKAYEYLLNLEGTLTVDFRTMLGLLTDKATKYSREMQGKIERYPGKFKSSLRTLKKFLSLVSQNTDDLVEVSETALRHANVVLISVEAFRNMMKDAEPENTKPQPFKSFLQVTNIAQTIARGATADTTFDEALTLVESVIPKLVDFGVGFYEIQETPDLSSKVDQTVEKSRKVVEEIRKISTELRNANENIKKNSIAVDDLKKNTEAYNIENMKVQLLIETFEAVFKGGEKLGETVAKIKDHQPKVYEFPPARTTTTTTTSNTSTPTISTSTTSTTTTNSAMTKDG